MTETITIECEWDEGQLRLEWVLLNDKKVLSPPKEFLCGGIFHLADELAKAVGRWKIEQDKRNVSP